MSFKICFSYEFSKTPKGQNHRYAESGAWCQHQWSRLRIAMRKRGNMFARVTLLYLCVPLCLPAEAGKGNTPTYANTHTRTMGSRKNREGVCWSTRTSCVPHLCSQRKGAIRGMRGGGAFEVAEAEDSGGTGAVGGTEERARRVIEQERRQGLSRLCVCLCLCLSATCV